MLELIETPEPRRVESADGRVTGYYEYGDPTGMPVGRTPRPRGGRAIAEGGNAMIRRP